MFNVCKRSYKLQQNSQVCQFSFGCLSDQLFGGRSTKACKYALRQNCAFPSQLGTLFLIWKVSLFPCLNAHWLLNDIEGFGIGLGGWKAVSDKMARLTCIPVHLWFLNFQQFLPFMLQEASQGVDYVQRCVGKLLIRLNNLQKLSTGSKSFLIKSRQFHWNLNYMKVTAIFP